MPVIKSPTDASMTAPEFGAVVRRGLKYINIARGTLERSRVNLAPGKPLPDAGIIGLPTMADGGSSLLFKTGSNYFSTAIPDYLTHTIYMAIKSDATMADQANMPVFAGCGGGPPLLEDTTTNTFGSLFRVTISGAVRFGGGFGTSVSDDSQVSSTVAVTHATWHFVVAKVIASGANKGTYIKNMTTGDADADASVADRFPTKLTYNLGSGQVVNEAGTNKVAWFQVHDVETTTDEDNATYAQVAAYQSTVFGRTL